MTNYRNIYSGEVISEYHYNLLSESDKRKYVRTYESVTHTVEESPTGDIITTLLVADMLSDSFNSDNNSSFDTGSDSSFDSSFDSSSSSDFGGGGGGDFGGGGSGGDF